MLQTASKSGITFAVDDVTPAASPRLQCPMYEEVRRRLESDIESCSDYHGWVIKYVDYQPLLAAVYIAFSEHRPLVLTPDAVWITIAQGVAHHMALHGEQLRSRFVAHSGKLELVVTVQGWVKGSPENPWADAFAGWSSAIRQHVGPSLHETLKCDFSTTGPVEKAVGDIVIMDIFERYFEYVLLCVCGIPRITLEGTPEDWDKLHEKVKGLRIFDMDWWLDSLEAITAQFFAASRGDVDLKHWQSICKLRNAYGDDIINGWVCRLFPYIRDFANGPCRTRNPIFESGEGMTSFSAPSGLSQVPFKWEDSQRRESWMMHAIGGLIGVSQEDQTLALRPYIGWAVRQASHVDVLIAQVKNEHHTRPPVALTDDRKQMERSLAPSDFKQFYGEFGSACLFGDGDDAAVQMLPLEQMSLLNFGEEPSYDNLSFQWHQFGRLRDGSVLAFNPQPYRGAVGDAIAKLFRLGERTPICVIRDLKALATGNNPVIASSFAELLERVLDGNGNLYWEDPQFAPITNAVLLTYTKAAGFNR